MMRKGIFAIAVLSMAGWGKEVVWKGTPINVEIAPEGSVVVNVPCRIKTVWWFPRKPASARVKYRTAVFFLTTEDISAGVICRSGRNYVLNIHVDYKEPEWDEKEMKWKTYRSPLPRTVVLDLLDPGAEEEQKEKIAQAIYMNKEEILAQGRALMVGMVTGRQVEGYTSYFLQKPVDVYRENLKLSLIKKYEGVLEGLIYRGENRGKMSLCVKEEDFSTKGTVYIYIDALRKSPACGSGFLLLPGDIFYLYIVRAPLPREDLIRIPYLRKEESVQENKASPENQNSQTEQTELPSPPPVPGFPPVKEFPSK